MPVPATTGQLRTSVKDMAIGDYIYGSYTNASSYYIGDTQGTTETPVLGKTTDVTGYWYYIKVDTGLLISDRIVWHTVSWDALNTAKLIQGRPLTTKDGTEGIMRSITGGVAYADANGNRSLTQLNMSYGAFPSNNEYDKYIVRSKLKGRVTPDNEDVWHHKSMFTWVQETPIVDVFKNIGGATKSMVATERVVRGNITRTDSEWKDISTVASNSSSITVGFRPVFAFKEVQ